MAKILYAVSGEGRGHATRARTLVDELRHQHEVVIYASGQAYRLLADTRRWDGVEVCAIPGLRFHYDARHRLDHLATARGSLSFLSRLPGQVRQFTREIERQRADLVITDFEPIFPRAAARCGIPYLSIDHQHFLVTYDLSSLPRDLMRHAKFMSAIVHAYYRKQIHTVVSSFYFPPLLPGLGEVTQTGVLLRKEVVTAVPEMGSHLVAYLRRRTDRRVLEALAGSGPEVRIYGLGAREPAGRLRFLDIDPERFVDDLATSRGLISTAGNQLLGEALYLGKPILAMPEAGNREQEINAHFLELEGKGQVTTWQAIDASRIREFLDRAPGFTDEAARRKICGNPEALRIIRACVGEGSAGTALAPAA